MDQARHRPGRAYGAIDGIRVLVLIEDDATLPWQRIALLKRVDPLVIPGQTERSQKFGIAQAVVAHIAVPH